MAVGVEHLGRADPPGLVHPHVQRRVLRVREAAVGLVELHGGDAEVEEDAVDPGDVQALQHLGDLVVDRVHQGGPVAEGGQPLAGELERGGVAVHRDQPDVRELGEQCLAVAAEAEGGVHHHRSGPGDRRGQGVHAPLQHHRDVLGTRIVGAHALWRPSSVRKPPDVRGAPPILSHREVEPSHGPGRAARGPRPLLGKAVPARRRGRCARWYGERVEAAGRVGRARPERPG